MNKLNNCERIERDALEGKVILASQAGLDALAKRIKLVDLGVIIEGTENLEVIPNKHSLKYLTTKKTRMSHNIFEV